MAKIKSKISTPKAHTGKATRTPATRESVALLPGGIEVRSRVLRGPDGPEFPYADRGVWHRYTDNDIMAIACEFDTSWGVGEPWLPDEAFWMGPCREKLLTEYGYNADDLPAMTVTAICELFRYTYARDARAATEGSAPVRSPRGQVRFYRDAGELLRKLAEVGGEVYRMRCDDTVRDHWDAQIATLLGKLREYTHPADGYDVATDPFPFASGYFRLLDLPAERPAAYTITALCLKFAGGMDVVPKMAAEMGVAWAPFVPTPLIGHAEAMDVWLQDIERDLAQHRPCGKPRPEQDGGVAGRADCTHSEDFATVVWYGTEYHFNKTEARCVRALWSEWEKNPDAAMALHQYSIRDLIKSESETFRLALVFRHNGKPHPAWQTMIHGLGDGRFYLGKPKAKAAKNRRKASKKRKITE